MQIKETPDVSFPGVVESPPLEDVVVLADSAGVALGVQRAFSARVRSVRDERQRPHRVQVRRDPARRVATARSPGSCAAPAHGPTRAACSPPAERRRRGRSGTWRNSWSTTSTTFSL